MNLSQFENLPAEIISAITRLLHSYDILFSLLYVSKYMKNSLEAGGGITELHIEDRTVVRRKYPVLILNRIGMFSHLQVLSYNVHHRKLPCGMDWLMNIPRGLRVFQINTKNAIDMLITNQRHFPLKTKHEGQQNEMSASDGDDPSLFCPPVCFNYRPIFLDLLFPELNELMLISREHQSSYCYNPIFESKFQIAQPNPIHKRSASGHLQSSFPLGSSSRHPSTVEETPTSGSSTHYKGDSKKGRGTVLWTSSQFFLFLERLPSSLTKVIIRGFPSFTDSLTGTQSMITAASQNDFFRSVFFPTHPRLKEMAFTAEYSEHKDVFDILQSTFENSNAGAEGLKSLPLLQANISLSVATPMPSYSENPIFTGLMRNLASLNVTFVTFQFGTQPILEIFQLLPSTLQHLAIQFDHIIFLGPNQFFHSYKSQSQPRQKWTENEAGILAPNSNLISLVFGTNIWLNHFYSNEGQLLILPKKLTHLQLGRVIDPESILGLELPTTLKFFGVKKHQESNRIPMSINLVLQKLNRCKNLESLYLPDYSIGGDALQHLSIDSLRKVICNGLFLSSPSEFSHSPLSFLSTLILSKDTILTDIECARLPHSLTRVFIPHCQVTGNLLPEGYKPIEYSKREIISWFKMKWCTKEESGFWPPVFQHPTTVFDFYLVRLISFAIIKAQKGDVSLIGMDLEPLDIERFKNVERMVNIYNNDDSSHYSDNQIAMDPKQSFSSIFRSIITKSYSDWNLTQTKEPKNFSHSPLPSTKITHISCNLESIQQRDLGMITRNLVRLHLAVGQPWPVDGTQFPNLKYLRCTVGPLPLNKTQLIGSSASLQWLGHPTLFPALESLYISNNVLCPFDQNLSSFLPRSLKIFHYHTFFKSSIEIERFSLIKPETIPLLPRNLEKLTFRVAKHGFEDLVFNFPTQALPIDILTSHLPKALKYIGGLSISLEGIPIEQNQYLQKEHDANPDNLGIACFKMFLPNITSIKVPNAVDYHLPEIDKDEEDEWKVEVDYESCSFFIPFHNKHCQ